MVLCAYSDAMLRIFGPGLSTNHPTVGFWMPPTWQQHPCWKVCLGASGAGRKFIQLDEIFLESIESKLLVSWTIFTLYTCWVSESPQPINHLWATGESHRFEYEKNQQNHNRQENNSLCLGYFLQRMAGAFRCFKLILNPGFHWIHGTGGLFTYRCYKNQPFM